jgi:predicted component of type VI protein secretion system
MSNNNFSGDISPEKLNTLMKMASSKLGMTTDQLKTVLSDKKATDELLGKIGGKGKFNSTVQNPENLEKIINENPKMKKLLSELMEGRDHG